MITWLRFGGAWIGFALAVGTAAPSQDAAPLSFNRDIRPIFSENCFLCHGPDPGTRKAKLRLDVEAGAKAAVIIPGDVEKSPLARRIRAADANDRMPPSSSGKKLSERQIELLCRWIEQGARWEEHWAYAPIGRPAPPSTGHADWARNPIDEFILSRLEQEKLQPSPEADPRTLIRRLSFDLTGLPPRPEEVSAFLEERRAEAYEELVDRLLGSAHYGERMAVWWLDLVRYADSVGYHGDQTVSVWPYRDYVIGAFNTDRPFDQFTREQLAGDLLPGATLEQRVASGYNRLGMMSAEGGVQDKEYRAKYFSDRVRNVSGTWLGATVGCAECHDHKFDPYTTRDFYRLGAFFAELKEKGFYDRGYQDADWGPSLSLPNDDQQRRLKRIEAELDAARKIADAIDDETLAKARSEWELQALAHDAWGLLAWQNQKPLFATSANGAVLEINDDASVFVSGPNPDHETYVVTIPAPLDRITALRLEVLDDARNPGNQLARSGMTFVLSEVEIQARHGAQSSAPVPVAHVSADWEVEGFPAFALVDGRPDTAWAQGHGPPQDRRVVFHLAEPLQGGTNTALVVRLRHDSKWTRHAVGKFRLGLSGLEWAPAPENGVPDDVLKALKVAPAKRDDRQKKLIARHYRKVAPVLSEPLRTVAHLEAQRSLLQGQIPRTLVAETTTPRPIRILPRGNWMDDSGEVVAPGTPHFLRQLDTGTNRASRLDLADWIVARDNPLAARVLVNRLWRMFFGVGLSKSTDDFGAQGEWPMHPELLDWLASDLMDHGWSLKRTIRLMVTSATYRQSSKSTPVLEMRDPDNRLYARQTRVRLEAEFIRDNALAVSGLLVDQVGGPSVKPWQPPAYWAALNFPKREYEPDRGPATWRRGLYTHWQRTFLHPALLAFDAATREECTVNRPVSNTPQQALVLLNDPQFVEAARVFARRVCQQEGDFDQRLTFAYAQALGRPPSTEETRTLRQLFEQHRAVFARDSQAARALVTVGGAPAPADPGLPDLAAWTSVSRALLNLHETITRN